MTNLHFKFSGLSLGSRLCIQSSTSKHVRIGLQQRLLVNQSYIIQSICRCSANRLYMKEENDLFSRCIKDGTLKIGDSTKNGYVHNRTIFIQCLVLQTYKLVSYTVWKFRPSIMKIFKIECLLNAQLPNTHACSSTAQEFCLNPLL